MKRLLLVILFVVWTVGLLIPILGGPGPEVPRDPVNHFIAKSVHVSVYAILTLYCGWLKLPARYRCILIFLIMAHSTVTEILQNYFPPREGTLRDVGFNTLGIFIGLTLGWKWWTQPDPPKV